MGLLKVLTITLILLFPLGELGRINIYNEISTTVNDILVFSLIALWLLKLIIKKGLPEIAKNQLAKPIFLFVLVAFISLVFNINKLSLSEFSASFLYLLRFVSYAGIYFIVSEFDASIKQKILVIIVISGSLIILGGFVQYFFYPNLRNLYYLGWDEHLYRLFSSFLDPNFAATIISLFLVLLLSLLFNYNKRFWQDQNGNFARVSLTVLSILSFVALLLTYSRSGYLMFIASVSALFIITGRKRYIAILIAVFVLGLVILPKDFGGEGVKLLRTASIISRSEYVGNAITIFRDNPILGVGFNAYRYAQYRYGFIDEKSLTTSHAAAGTDNSFLFVLATTGIVGFAFYLYMWFRIIGSCYSGTLNKNSKLEYRNSKQYQVTKIQNSKPRHTWPKRFEHLDFENSNLFRISDFDIRIFAAAIIASSVGLFVNAFFINSLFYSFIMEWMWILIGLSSSTTSNVASKLRA